MNKKTNKRREFLALGLLAGAGALTGFKAMKLICEPREKIKLISADGKVVEVDARYLPPTSSKPLSNSELQQWLEKNKNSL